MSYTPVKQHPRWEVWWTTPPPKNPPSRRRGGGCFWRSRASGDLPGPQAPSFAMSRRSKGSGKGGLSVQARDLPSLPNPLFLSQYLCVFFKFTLLTACFSRIENSFLALQELKAMTAARIAQTQTAEQQHYQQHQFRDEQRGYATTLAPDQVPPGQIPFAGSDRQGIHAANMSMRQTSTSPLSFGMGGGGNSPGRPFDLQQVRRFWDKVCSSEEGKEITDIPSSPLHNHHPHRSWNTLSKCRHTSVCLLHSPSTPAYRSTQARAKASSSRAPWQRPARSAAPLRASRATARRLVTATSTLCRRTRTAATRSRAPAPPTRKTPSQTTDFTALPPLASGA